jgi:hypothetical protein
MELNDNTIGAFKDEVNQFAQIDKLINQTKDLMKPLQEKLKRLMVERRELENQICSTMEVNDIKMAELPGSIGMIEHKTRNALVPLTRVSIKNRIIDFFNNGPGHDPLFNSKYFEMKGQLLFDYIYAKENREYTKKGILKSKFNGNSYE